MSAESRQPAGKRPLRVAAYRGKWVAVAWIAGKRHRFSLGNLDATEATRPIAERACGKLAGELSRPVSDNVQDIMTAYLDDTRAIDKERLKNAWKQAKWIFADLTPDQIDRSLCRTYVARRTAEGAAIGTIRKEMTVVRAGLNWADLKNRAVWELPSPPPPRDRWLSHAEFGRLLAAAEGTPHLHLFLHLAIATAGRQEAILTLSWTQVRWDRNEIWLGYKPNGKQRATVPMTATLRDELEKAHKLRGASGRVIELDGEAIASVRKSFDTAVRRAGLTNVHRHDIRHTAAVWMAGAGVPLEKISEYLGHSDIGVTKRVYARFQPEHLTDAAAAVNLRTVLPGSGEPLAREQKQNTEEI